MGTAPGAAGALAAARQDSLEDLLAAAPADEAQAWRELALRWNLAIGDGEPCAVAAQAGLACFRSASGGLALLRTLDRPVWLTLRQRDGARMRVLLTGLGASEAVLEAGGRRHALPLAVLAGLWRGEFATWWMPPPGAAGDASSRRVWLEAALDAVLNTAANAAPSSALDPARPSRAGASLQERVAAFQLLAGLPVDGQAGPLTLMQLSRWAGAATTSAIAGPAEPRLGLGAPSGTPLGTPPGAPPGSPPGAPR